MILFIICFVVSLLYQRFVLRRDTEGGADEDGRLMSAAAAVERARTAPFSNAPVATSSRSLLAAIVIVPLVYVVLGGFRTTGQIARTRSALPAPVGHGQLRQRAHVRAASGGRSATARSSPRSPPSLVVGARRRWRRSRSSRYQFRGREAIYTLFTLGLLFPIGVAILPLYLLLRQLGLLDTPLGVALPEAAFGLPITIVILRPFMRASRASSRTRRRSTAARGSASSGASCCRSRGRR